MAAKKNSGISALKSLDMNKLTESADLNEVRKPKQAETVKDTRAVMKSLRIPKYLSDTLSDIIKEGKYTGSANTYITEALRKQLIKDGYLDS